MRRQMLPLQVQVEQNSPQKLHYQQREQRVVRILDTWRYGGRWWRFEGRRDYYLLELEGGVVAEVFRDGERWILSRTAD